MKTNKLWIVALSAIALCAGFASCSDDDDDTPPKHDETPAQEWWEEEGSKIEMSKTPALILNEGSMGKNNAGITYFDWETGDTYDNDLFMTQNEIALGDVAQDIIEGEDGYIYVIMSSSKVIYKLNTAGVLIASMSFPAELGDPRYGVSLGKYLYVTCYGGFVAKVDTEQMTVEDKVTVGANPEYMVEDNETLYCTCSGWGKDNRVAAIDTKTFGEATFYEVMYNPDRIAALYGSIYVQGYGTYYDYPWGKLDTESNTFMPIGNASAWTTFNGHIYGAYSDTDWSTYETTTTFFCYDAEHGGLRDLLDAPEELRSKSVYGISVNPMNGDIYVMTSDFNTNGVIYRFNEEGTFVSKFESTGVNPRKIVFFNYLDAE